MMTCPPSHTHSNTKQGNQHQIRYIYITHWPTSTTITTTSTPSFPPPPPQPPLSFHFNLFPHLTGEITLLFTIPKFSFFLSFFPHTPQLLDTKIIKLQALFNFGIWVQPQIASFWLVINLIQLYGWWVLIKFQSLYNPISNKQQQQH